MQREKLMDKGKPAMCSKLVHIYPQALFLRAERSQ
jgi:hypothetical protein